MSSSKQDRSRAPAPQAKAVKPQAAPPQKTEAPAALQRAAVEPGLASPHDLRALQRRVGNRATARLVAGGGAIQAKLTVGPTGDKYEQEADRVVGDVMRLTAPAAPPASPGVAPDERAQRQLLGQGITPLVQREASPADGSFDAGPEVEGKLAANKGAGNPLPLGTRSFMENRFAANFEKVRVHTGGEAAKLNRSLSAQAFTHGPDIYMGEGKYNPGTSAGNRLLAHELTHVVQQGAAGGTVQTKPQVVQRILGEDEEGPQPNLPGQVMDNDGGGVPEGLGEMEPQNGVENGLPNGPEPMSMPVGLGQVEPQKDGGGDSELPMFLKALKWGFVDKPSKAYKYGRNKGWGKLRSGGLAFGEGLLTAPLGLAGSAGVIGASAIASPFALAGGMLGGLGLGMDKLTNYATGGKDTGPDWSEKSTGQKVKSGAGYIGKGLMSPLTLLGLGLGTAGRGVEMLGNSLFGKEDKKVDWSQGSKSQKAKQAMKYIGLGLLSPLALPFLGLGAGLKALWPKVKDKWALMRGKKGTGFSAQKSSSNFDIPHTATSVITGVISQSVGPALEAGSIGAQAFSAITGPLSSVLGFIKGTVSSKRAHRARKRQNIAEQTLRDHQETDKVQKQLQEWVNKQNEVSEEQQQQKQSELQADNKLFLEGVRYLGGKNKAKKWRSIIDATGAFAGAVGSAALTGGMIAAGVGLLALLASNPVGWGIALGLVGAGLLTAIGFALFKMGKSIYKGSQKGVNREKYANAFFELVQKGYEPAIEFLKEIGVLKKDEQSKSGKFTLAGFLSDKDQAKAYLKGKMRSA